MKQKLDPRHQARVTALQALFEWSFNSTDVETIVKRDAHEYMQIGTSSKKGIDIDRPLALFITQGVTENLDTIDKIIETCAPEWPLAQIAKVDLEILRIAIFELHIASNVPLKVAIDEAVELAKEFGGENSSKFVNGVLGTVVKQMMPGTEEKKTSRKVTLSKKQSGVKGGGKNE